MKYVLCLLLALGFNANAIESVQVESYEETKSIQLTQDFIDSLKGEPLTEALVLEKVKEYLKKIFGPEIVDLILELIGIKEFKDSVFAIYTNSVIMVQSPSLCPLAVSELSGELMYITSYVAVMYQTRIPPAASAAAVVARLSAKEVMTISTMNELICKTIVHPK
jgi:hypothetical protein